AADAERLKLVAGKLNAPLGEIEKKLEALLTQQKEMEKELKTARHLRAGGIAKELLGKVRDVGGTKVIVENVGALTGDQLQEIADALKGQFQGVIVLAGVVEGNVALVASVAQGLTSKFQAGKIIQQIAPIVGGKGGGRPDNARGAGKDAGRLNEALEEAGRMLGQ
ncbi:MAG: DHHA1 domain-containing protein, partial [Chthoniobacteraceae bacterium]